MLIRAIIDVNNADLKIDELWIDISDPAPNDSTWNATEGIGLNIRNRSNVYILGNYKSTKTNLRGNYTDSNTYYGYGGMGESIESSILISSFYININVNSFSTLISDNSIFRTSIPSAKYRNLQAFYHSIINLSNASVISTGSTTGSDVNTTNSAGITSAWHSKIYIKTGVIWPSSCSLNANYIGILGSTNSNIHGSNVYHPYMCCNGYTYNYNVVHLSSIEGFLCDYSGTTFNVSASHHYVHCAYASSSATTQTCVDG